MMYLKKENHHQRPTSFDDNEALDDQCNFNHQSNTNFREKVILEEEIESAERMKVLVKQQCTTDACSCDGSRSTYQF